MGSFRSTVLLPLVHLEIVIHCGIPMNQPLLGGCSRFWFCMNVVVPEVPVGGEENSGDTPVRDNPLHAFIDPGIARKSDKRPAKHWLTNG